MSRELVDSNIYYLGKIPNNWISKKYKYFSDLRMGETILASSTVSEGIPIYSATKEDKIFGYVKEANVKLKKGELVIPARGNSIGYVSIVKEKEATCTQTTICSYNIHDINNKFLYYSILGLNNEWFKFDGSAIPQITVEQVKDCILAIPPENEQELIVEYLDNRVLLINETIENNKKEIELLEEYKNQRINELVTKGINSSDYKYSGIESIGDIPKDWKVRKLKFVANSISKGNGITREEVHEDGDIQCVRYGEIYTKYNNSFDKTFSKTYINQIISPKYISKGDILFAATGELLEEIGKNIVYLGEEPCIVGGDIIILNHSQEPRYLNYLLNSKSIQEQKSFGKSKLKVVHIYPNEISNIKVILPSLNEQKEIANYLDKMVIQLDKVIEYRKQIIEKLEEYKKSLIYEAVTGKIEV